MTYKKTLLIVSIVLIASVAILGFGVVPTPADLAGLEVIVNGEAVLAESITWYGWSFENLMNRF